MKNSVASVKKCDGHLPSLVLMAPSRPSQEEPQSPGRGLQRVDLLQGGYVQPPTPPRHQGGHVAYEVRGRLLQRQTCDAWSTGSEWPPLLFSDPSSPIAMQMSSPCPYM